MTYNPGGGDLTPPVVNATHAVLKGTADDNSGPLSQITVNGSTVTVTSGNWTSGEVGLGGSITTINVVAQDASTNSKTVSVAVDK